MSDGLGAFGPPSGDPHPLGLAHRPELDFEPGIMVTDKSSPDDDVLRRPRPLLVVAAEAGPGPPGSTRARWDRPGERGGDVSLRLAGGGAAVGGRYPLRSRCGSPKVSPSALRSPAPMVGRAPGRRTPV